MKMAGLIRKLPRVRCKDYSVCMLYDKKPAEDKLRGLSLAACNSSNDSDTTVYVSDIDNYVFSETQLKLTVSDKMYCNCCECTFDDRKEQEQHYKSDWHRYNLRLKLGGFKTVKIEDFEKIANYVSSISGSEDEVEGSSDEETEGQGHSKLKGNLALPSHVKSSAASCSSDSESESTSKKARNSKHQMNKIYLKTNDGELISLYKCLLYHKKNRLTEQNDLIEEIRKLPQKTNSAIFMSAGGHFAGAIFNGKQVIAHKTFHRYVVRAKRGTAQSSRDSQGGNAPKSAGASLRRYNEAALIQEIQDWIMNNGEVIKSCDYLFLRAPSFNRKIFYGGKNPPFTKDDDRIRVIPFPTRRPTYNEVKRVHEMLSSIECYGQESELKDAIPISPMRQLSSETGQLEVVEDVNGDSPRHRSDFSKKGLKDSPKDKQHASKEKQKGQLNPRSLIPDHLQGEESTASESELIEIETVISTDHLKEYDSVTKPNRQKSPKKKKKNPNKHQVEPDEDVYAEERYHLQNALYTACKTGDLQTLSALMVVFRGTDITPCVLTPGVTLSNIVTSLSIEAADYVRDDMETNGSEQFKSNETSEVNGKNVNSDKDIPTSLQPENRTSNVPNTLPLPKQTMRFGGYTLDQLSPLMTIDILNKPFGDNGTTLLHVASRSNHKKVLSLLMKYGADPTAKDKNGCLPYNVSDTRDTRNEFRRFMAIYPDKYDYQRAQIPGPLTSEMEDEKRQKEAERKSRQKKAKAEKLKIQREKDADKIAEEKEKKRFLNLSDREKRLLAAERRLVNQHQSVGNDAPVLSRCYNCGVDITGKVPFEYSDFRFCSTKCLREHRSKYS